MFSEPFKSNIEDKEQVQFIRKIGHLPTVIRSVTSCSQVKRRTLQVYFVNFKYVIMHGVYSCITHMI